MARLPRILVLLFCLLCSVGSAQTGEEIIVTGTPPVTMNTVAAHLRLLELALETRLTAAQKEYFIAEVKALVPKMAPVARRGFFEAVELANSLGTMKPYQMQGIKDVLKTDLEESTPETRATDPAARLFFLVQANLHGIIAGKPPQAFSRQSLEAFFEYVSFLRTLSGKSAPLTPADKKRLEDTFRKGFASFTPALQKWLSTFEHTWYQFRTALKTASPQQRQTWEQTLKSAMRQTPAGDLGISRITTAFQPELWQDVLKSFRE